MPQRYNQGHGGAEPRPDRAYSMPNTPKRSTPAARVSGLPTSVLCVGLALALVTRVETACAAAVYCPLPAGASLGLGALDAKTRLDWIDARLSNTGSHSRSWVWLW